MLYDPCLNNCSLGPLVNQSVAHAIFPTLYIRIFPLFIHMQHHYSRRWKTCFNVQYMFCSKLHMSESFHNKPLLTSVHETLLGPSVESSSWLVFLLPFSSQLLLLYWFCILLMAHLGYLHLTRASLRCSNSPLTSSGVVHTVLALWVKGTNDTVLSR